jgi:NTP pyrophosphatase (non-canonical NTP hydrolase)
MNTREILNDILLERAAQDAKWGEQNHEPETWMAILMEEVGELAQAVLHWRFGGPAAGDIRLEAVQVAAVALALIECHDRNHWLERA